MDFSEDIRKSIGILQSGGSLLYPTDTVWGLGCDATNYQAVEKIYRIKRRTERKSLIVLIDSFFSLEIYVRKIPEILPDLLASISNPVTIIYSNARNLAPNVIADDGTIAIRIVSDLFCRELIRQFGRPVVSTSANISGAETPALFSQISQEIKEKADYTVRYGQDIFTRARPSTIIRLFEDGQYTMIRE